MYRFIQHNGVHVIRDERTLLSNLHPSFRFIKPKWSYESPLTMELNPVSVAETEVVFEDEHHIAKLALTILEENGCFALKATGFYDQGKMGPNGFGGHLQDTEGLYLHFGLKTEERFMAAHMRCQFWQKPFISTNITKMPNRTQSLLFRQNGETGFFMTTCDKDWKSELSGEENGVCLTAHSNAILDTLDDILLIGAFGEDPYTLPETVAGFGLQVMQKPGKLRRDKKYPAIFEYLGWCSWDAFHMDCTEQNLLDKCKEFGDKNIPVRWIILDDMCGDVPGIQMSKMHTCELNSWKADPIRFPGGWQGLTEKVKADWNMWVGIWHPTTGYWRGIKPDGELAREHGELLSYTIPCKWTNDSRLIHSWDKEKIEKYYDLQHKYYHDCGFDFTKVDNQGSAEELSHIQLSVGKAGVRQQDAIEKISKKYYGGALINCMGMPEENFWNRRESTVCRFSGDFQPENRKWFVQHLLQCSYNSLTQGTLFCGDWDMWWSDDAQAKKNAVLRAMSGGPIYMSDELNRSIRDVIMPTCFSDGRIIRLEQPALPSPDCLLEDQEHNGKIFKVFNAIGKCGVLAAFNLDENEKPVKGTVSSCDINGLRNATYCVYDWFARTATVLKPGRKLKLELQNYDDFRLLLFVPVFLGRAAIGLAEKYMAPATFTQKGGRYTVKDDGTFLLYAEETPEGFEPVGEHLYKRIVKKGETI